MDAGTDTNMLDNESSDEAVVATQEEESENEVSTCLSKTCHICQRKLPTVQGRKYHEKACAKLRFDNHHDDWPCSVCKYGGATPQDIHKHELLSHRIHPGHEGAAENEKLPRTMSQRTRGLTCLTCGKLVSQKEYDKQHGKYCRVGKGKNKARPKQKRKGKPLDSSDPDTDDESDSSQEDALTCKKCGVRFESGLHLRRHVNLCTKDDKFVFGCTLCGRNVGDVSRMLHHEAQCQREGRMQDIQRMKYLTPVSGSDDSEDEHTTGNAGPLKSQWCNLCGVKLSHYRRAYRRHRWRCRQREEKILYDLKSFNTPPDKQNEVSTQDSSRGHPCETCKGNDSLQTHTPPAVSSSLDGSPTEDTITDSDDKTCSVNDDTPASCSNVDTPASCSNVDTPASCSNVDTPASCSNMDMPALCSKPVFRCTVCGFGTCTMRRLQVHMDRHRGDDRGTYICHSCNQTFPTKTLLEIHHRSHASQVLKDKFPDARSIPVSPDSTADTNKALLPQLQNAILLKKRFYSELTFKQPLHRIISLGKARHERGKVRGNAHYQLYKCRMCDYSAWSLSCMQQHAVWHCRCRDVCTICGKEVSYQYENDHYRRHADEEEGGHVCDICGKVLLNSSTLAIHRRKMHQPSQSVLCDVCGHRAKDKDTLAAHKLTHSLVKPHQCTVCGKAFARSDYLHRHTKSHLRDEDRPFKCDNCGKGFTRKQYLQLHLDKQVCSQRRQNNNKDKKCKSSKPKSRKTGQHSESDDDQETTNSEIPASKVKKRAKKKLIENAACGSEINSRNVRPRKETKTRPDPQVVEESGDDEYNLGDGDQETRDSELRAPKERKKGKKQSLENKAGGSEINRCNVRPRKNTKTRLCPDIYQSKDVNRRNKIAKLDMSSENKKGPNARNTRRTSKLKTSDSVVDAAEAVSDKEGPESASASRSGVYGGLEAGGSLRDSDSADKALEDTRITGGNDTDTTNNVNEENSNSGINQKVSLVLKPALIKRVTRKLIRK